MKEDIRPLKAKLREQYKTLRRNMMTAEKNSMDNRIAKCVSRLWQYKKSRLILTYVSTKIEVDTHKIIRRAINDGKQVAVPRCVEGTRRMEFYRINSLDELKSGAFGVSEPEPLKINIITNFSNSLCLVPALCYDWNGFRLGYGKGYYDRFLDSYLGTTVGIAYSSCVCQSLPHGKYDCPVDLLVTERYLRRTSTKKQVVQKHEELTKQLY